MNGRRVVIIGNQALTVANFRSVLIKDIVARGHEVFAVAPNFDTENRLRIKEVGATAVDVPLSRTGINPFRDLRDTFRLWQCLRQLKPNVVLASTIKPVIYGTIAATVSGVPDRFALITGLGYAFSESVTLRDRAVQFIAKELYRIALRQTRMVFVQNPDDADELVEENIVSRDKIMRVNGTGVDLDEWPVLNLPELPITFTLAARLLGEKGIREYAAAARRVKHLHPDVRFLLLGDLDSNPSAIPEQEIAGWVSEGLIEWPGYVDIRPWMAQTSIYILPSYREGVPRSTQEAMSSGRPIITTDVPGCRETVNPGKNGFRVPPKDVEALVSAMLFFIDNPEQIEIMGQASRALAEERFNVHPINEQILAAMDL